MKNKTPKQTLKQLNLSDQEIFDILNFLQSLAYQITKIKNINILDTEKNNVSKKI